jgi:predicted transglutaminase-like cysteine proteinase
MMIANVFSTVLSARSGRILMAALVACALDAFPASAGSEWLTHGLVSGITRPPVGWLEFCARHPNECAGGTMPVHDVVLTAKRWNDLVRVNKLVNKTIKPLSDLKHWDVVERWSYPDDGYGDCEDYVLLKRRMLMQAGWPRQALLITVVRDKRGDGHAVLTVKTDKGEFILDNQNGEVLVGADSGYRFVKRQSQSDPNIWVALGDPRPASATATSR